MMTIPRYLTAICLGLAACSLYTAHAFAQERQPSSQPQNSSRSTIIVAPGDFPWDTVEWIEQRYKIEAMRFKARDESGVDWWGSDEVMVRTDDAKGSTGSNTIDDIDSGDTHHFDAAKSCVLAVRPGEAVLGKTSVCDDVGEPAPLSFHVEFWEDDFSLIPKLCKHLNKHHFPKGCIPGEEADDFIGRAEIDLSMQELETKLPQVGNEHIETVVLNPCSSGESVCDVTFGPDYSFTYRVTRLPDVRVGLGELLNEAMRKIGTRSQIEAIAAGLRSLHELSPRKVESETDAPPSVR